MKNNIVLTREEFKNLFENYFAKIRNYVFYRSGNAEIATDIAQETFLKIWEKNEQINPENVKGLLYKIASDLFVSHYRKERQNFDFFKYYNFKEESSATDEIISFNELKEIYTKALGKMKEKERTVFLMSRAEMLKYHEIAEILEISVKAVEKRMKGALGHLRKYIDENDR